MSNADYSEKRDFIRMQMNNTKATLSTNSQKHVPCVCVDLSAAGVLVETQANLVVGEVVHIEVPSKLSNFDALNAETEVVRVDELAPGQYRAALAIKELN